MYKTKKTYQVIALTMAMLIFFTSVGVSLDVHYCLGEATSASFFGKAKDCYELAGYKTPAKQQLKNRSNDLSHHFDRKSCCEHEISYLHLDTEAQNQLPSDASILSFNYVDFIFLFTQNNQEVKLNQSSFYYEPPLPEIEKHLLFQVFLI